MADALRFFQQYEAVLYFFLGVSAMVYGWRFWLAWQEVRGAIYGLEQTSGQRRLNNAALMLFLLLVAAVIVFMLVTFFAPAVIPETILPIDPDAEINRATPDPNESVAEESDAFATATPLPTVAVSPAGCIPEQLQITNPVSGQTLSGSVPLEGTVNTDNFGFYKIEYARALEELWLTIQAGRTIVLAGTLVESWDTSQIPPGDYVLQLIVTDNEGNPQLPCRIPVRIEGTP